MAKPALVVFIALGLAMAGMSRTRAETEVVTAGKGGEAVWSTLLRYERQALHNYEFHLIATNGAAQLGDAIWTVSKTPAFQKWRDTCGTAAETLSYMADGYYRSGLRREVPEDWHFFAKRYAERRSACLSALRLDEQAYPLPFWFAR